MANYVFVGDPVEDFEDEIFDYNSSRRRRRRPNDFDCCVKIENKIDIDADAKGGDGGEGGEGGDNSSAAAAAASRGGVAVSVPVSVGVEENERDLVIPENGYNEIENEEDTASAPNGNEDSAVDTIAVANAGNGGNGGDGGDVKQSINAKIDNWTVIVCGDDKKQKDWARTFKVNSDEKDVDVKIEDDKIFLNGEKMDVKELKDGTKVFILKQ